MLIVRHIKLLDEAKSIVITRISRIFSMLYASYLLLSSIDLKWYSDFALIEYRKISDSKLDVFREISFDGKLLNLHHNYQSMPYWITSSCLAEIISERQIALVFVCARDIAPNDMALHVQCKTPASEIPNITKNGRIFVSSLLPSIIISSMRVLKTGFS